MSRYGWMIIMIGLIVANSGCRNRSNTQYGGGLFAGSSTIPAPATYSLNIPSIASKQPYYVPGQSNASGVSATLNPNVVAPIPNNNSSNNQAQLNGWRPTNDNPGVSNSGQSSTSAPTTFANNAGIPNGYRAVSGTALPGSGTSYTVSPDYQSTRVDETLDRTRLPATDASNVRATARNFPTGEMPRIAQLNPVIGNNQGSTNSVYRGQPVVGSPGYRTTPYVGTPPGMIAQPSVGTQPSVLAQSTAAYDPYTGGQLGWRDREIGSESLNR